MATPTGISQSDEPRRKRLLRILTSYYLIALVIGGAAIYLFSWLADEVLENEFSKINTNILLAIHAHATPTRTQIALFFTNFGSVAGVLVCSAIFVAYLFKVKQKLIAYTYLVTLAGSGIFVFVLKMAFHQARPHVFPHLVVENDFSFPSGHTVMSFTFWGFLAWYVISLNRKQIGRWLWGVLFVFIAACVALSRLYLGVHWPTDVAAGTLVALFWIVTCVTGQEWMKRWMASRRPTFPEADRPLKGSG